MGRVLKGEPDARAPTDTDAALIAPLVDMLLEGIAANLGERDGAMTEGFHFGARIETKRHLGLIVEAPDFHVLRSQLELNGGAKRGEFVLIVPVQLPEPVTSAASALGKAKLENASGEDKESLNKVTFAQGAMMEAEACLQAVIHRQKMTLGALGQLKPGDRLPLQEFALDSVVLGGGSNSRLGPCRLGQHGGMRAVQLRFEVRTSQRDDKLVRYATNATPDTASKTAEKTVEAKPQTPNLPDLSDLPGFAPDLLSEAS